MKFLIILCLAFSSAQAADTVRVCTYNILNFSLSNEDGRTAKFKTIMDSIRPDILVCQEVVEAPAVAKFLSDALGGEYFASTFNDGFDTDNQIFYKPKNIALLSADYYKTELRDIAEYRVIYLPSNDTVSFFSVHLKASDTDSDVVKRAQESQILYQHLANRDIIGGNIVLLGDFNFYSVEENGYWILAGIRALPTLIDPLGADWKRNDPQYSSYYTQSPRVQADAACGGGTGGGMDDRFDYIFMSPSIHKRMIPGSYTHYGNDGVARLNSSIDSPINTKYSAGIAAALRCASDHLPVYCDLVFEKPTGVYEVVEIDGNILPRYYDILGREVTEPVHGGLYLKVRGSKVEKIVY